MMGKSIKVFVTTILALLVVATTAHAAAQTPEQLEATVRALNQRLASQERRIAELEANQQGNPTPQQRQEFLALYKELQADASQRSTPGWLENVTFFGDLRLRYHFASFSNGSHEQNIGRFRLRVGAKKTWLDKQLEAGFRFATGSSDDPSSTNQSFTGNFGEKFLWVDLVYAKYQPKAFKGFTIVGGKMKNPFVHTNMIWDSDVNPEGVWAVYKYPGLGSFEPFLGFGFFQLAYNSTDADATLHAYQVGGTWKISKDVKWTTALAYYDYGHYEENYSRAKSNTESGGRLTAEEFNIINLTNKVSWKAFNLPMSAFFDYAHNCGNQLGGQSDAFAVGYKVGKNKKKGDWSGSYKYAYIEQNATVAAFSDSDFGNTNRKGHQWSVKHNLLDSLTAGVNLFYTQPVSGSSTGETQLLMLADLIWKF